jgi:hypothetical protein
MQLLRDNLTLWTSDMQGEGEGEKAEGDYISILRYFVKSMHNSLHFTVFGGFLFMIIGDASIH